jgi:hypothetical protein
VASLADVAVLVSANASAPWGGGDSEVASAREDRMTSFVDFDERVADTGENVPHYRKLVARKQAPIPPAGARQLAARG